MHNSNSRKQAQTLSNCGDWLSCSISYSAYPQIFIQLYYSQAPKLVAQGHLWAKEQLSNFYFQQLNNEMKL